MKTKLALLTLVIIGIMGCFLVYHYYSYIFSKRVVGEIAGIDRVLEPTAVITGSRTPSPQLFSFAIAIKQADGDIMTSSSEDRQWAVVEKGQCAEAKFFPYPPWQLDKAGTYFGARLIRLYPCPE